MNAHRDEPATKGDLDQLKQELITKIEANSAKIDANGKKIDENTVKIDANGKKIDDISVTLSRLTSLVLDNRERMATKEEMNNAWIKSSRVRTG